VATKASLTTYLSTIIFFYNYLNKKILHCLTTKQNLCKPLLFVSNLLSRRSLTYSDEAKGVASIRGVQHIDPKLLINAKFSYSHVKPVSVFVSVKNPLNDNAREYYKTDRIGRLVLIGGSVQF
jgi:hypothetical protein